MECGVIEWTIDELQRIIARKVFANNVLAERVGTLTAEVVELMSIIDELQADLVQARAVLSDLQAAAEVESDHAVVHPVSDEQPVPSG
jgi:hypothetical protein